MESTTEATRVLGPGPMDPTTDENLAFEKMLALFEEPFPDFMNMNAYLDMHTALDVSPAYVKFAEENHITDTTIAVQLIVVGLFLAQM